MFDKLHCERNNYPTHGLMFRRSKYTIFLQVDFLQVDSSSAVSSVLSGGTAPAANGEVKKKRAPADGAGKKPAVVENGKRTRKPSDSDKTPSKKGDLKRDKSVEEKKK